jgi:large subunit ribosomal protein L4
MKITIYNQKAEETEKAELPSEIFDVKINPDLVHQVVVSQMANRRQVSAHTKGRAEKRGGGRKPWRQKGTGRARVGSRRSPIWRGGGVTFGPTKEKNYKQIVPKKMRVKALFMVLTQKLIDKEIIILDEIKLEKTNTKAMAGILEKFPCKGKTKLIALPKMDKNIILSTRNIAKTDTIQTKDLNCLDILSYKYLMLSKEAVDVIKATFLKSK